jgi:hypothetical protein
MSTEDVEEVSTGPTGFGRGAIEVQVVELPRDNPEAAAEGEDSADSDESLPASGAPSQRGP